MNKITTTTTAYKGYLTYHTKELIEHIMDLYDVSRPIARAMLARALNSNMVRTELFNQFDFYANGDEIQKS